MHIIFSQSIDLKFEHPYSKLCQAVLLSFPLGFKRTRHP